MAYYYVFVKPNEPDDCPLIKEEITDEVFLEKEAKEGGGKKSFMLYF